MIAGRTVGFTMIDGDGEILVTRAVTGIITGLDSGGFLEIGVIFILKVTGMTCLGADMIINSLFFSTKLDIT